MTERIAVIGLACRYPDAADPGQLWETVLARRVAFRRLPPQRLPLADYGGEGADQTYLTHAGLITGWQFDRTRFRVSGQAYRAADEAHWLALETGAAALADAGFPDGAGLDRGRAGVILGNTLTGEFSRANALRGRWPYVRRAVLAALAGSPLGPDERAGLLGSIERHYKAPFPAPTDESLAGALSNTIAGRICNHFDFHGTGYTVDGACASSLLAVSHAAAALCEGQLEVVLTGGVDLSLDPFELVGFARAGALARAEMRVYDRRPTGFLPGEGCGMVVLCRESFARRLGLRVYAYLLGWGASADGSGGLIRPAPAGQVLALRRAYRRAGLTPGDIRLVEGHGTGTEVGDLAELTALRQVRGPGARPAALGSIKANIGHTKAAAGVAGLLKAILAVHHGVLPPATGSREPHPMLTEPGVPLEILGEAREWPAGPRFAAVSAMGFGGINTHAVLGDAAPERAATRPFRARPSDHEVIVCTGRDRAELAATLTRLRAATQLSRAELTDLAVALARSAPARAPVRFAAAAGTPDELADAAGRGLAALGDSSLPLIDARRGVFLADERLRVALLFPGQVAPCHPGAGALGALLGELPPGYARPLPIPAGAPAATDVAQPAILRSSLAGLRWLDRLGVAADDATGHSLGEVAALVWAGALSEEDAYELVRARGPAMAAADPDRGGMAMIEADLETVTVLLKDTPVVVAADNGERNVVISGDRAAVGRVVDRAVADGVRSVWLPVTHAFHSPAMAAAAPRLREVAAALPWRVARFPYVSTVTGDRETGAAPVELLVRQLTAPVRFREALGRLAADLFVEVGPGHTLAGLTGAPTVSMDAGSPSAAGVAAVTAALFAAGRCDSVAPYFAGQFARRHTLFEPPVFLTNPCERAGPESPVPAPPPPASDPPPAAPPRTDTATARIGNDDPLAATIAAVAEALELDQREVPAEARLLADLHLSSLAVGRIAAAVATELGRAMPAAPLAVATATVGELAETIATLPGAGAADAPAAGVATWVRAFEPQLIESPAPDASPVPRDWELAGEPSGMVREAFRGTPGGAPARLLALPPDLGATPWADLLGALRRSHDDGVSLVVLHHGGIGAAAGRSLAAERPGVPVLVIEAPAGRAGVLAAAAEAGRPFHGYTEVVLGADGGRTVPVLAPMSLPDADPAAIPLGPGEVCVVTGGAKGIGAECAAALGAATGARMVLLGRAAETDVEVRSTLDRMTAIYRRVDVTDAATVTAAIAEIRHRYGPVRAVLHAAGSNVPARIPDLTSAAVAGTMAVKATGFANVLAALDLAELRLGVAFGSVIARTGLAGEAHYAMANEWLSRRCARLAREAADTRWLCVEWSAWSGAGMGLRLGVLDGLTRQGLSPIPPDAGTRLLLRLLSAPDLPPTVVVAGRLPSGGVQRLRGDQDLPSGRFVAEPLAWTPGVELVAAAGLTAGTDPYLADHRIGGAAVLPAVIGLEAMAQAAANLHGGDVPASFEGVAFRHPVTVPERAPRRLRVAALTREDGGADVVLRSSETGFATDHFGARYCPDTAVSKVAVAAAPDGPLLAAQHLYGSIFFHGPRFRRVVGYRAIAARRCTGFVMADPDRRWFGEFLDGRLLLGDPGARDAFLHLLQVCVPDRRVLPVRVDRIRMIRRPEGRLLVAAWQRAESDGEYRFDVLVTDAAGRPVEEWSGLVLRAAGPIEPERWPLEVVGARLARAHPGGDLDLAVARADPGDPDRSARVAAWLSGRPVHRAADGRLLTSGPYGVSASHLGEHLLVAARPGAVAVDWEAIGNALPPLDSADSAVADQWGGDPRAAAYRVWTCREVLRKLGEPAGAPLIIGDEAGSLTSGRHRLSTTTVATTAGPVAVAVGAG